MFRNSSNICPAGYCTSKSPDICALIVHPLTVLFLTGGLEDWFSLLLEGRLHIDSAHSRPHGFACVLFQLQKGPDGWRDCLSEEGPRRYLLLHSLPFEFLPNETS